MITNAGMDMQEVKVSFILKLVPLFWKHSDGFSKNLKRYLTCGPAISMLDICMTEL
jgi:hypothetical protein